LNVARALRFQGSVPLRFWRECVLAAAYLINRTPLKILNFKTLFEILYGVNPDYDHIKVFGCLCYSHNHEANQDKFDPCAIKCIFLGYPCGQKGWGVYDLERRRIFTSLDVTFYEAIFLLVKAHGV